jgi:hypothetical protein
MVSRVRLERAIQIADLYLVAASLRAVVMTHSQCVVYKGQRLRRGRLTTAQAPASPVEVFPVVLRADKLERDPNKGLNLLALDELDRGFHRPAALTLGVLEDGHI